jgi:formylglycine-generating enzyme required for sulfatase activity
MRQNFQWAFDNGRIGATTATVTNVEGDVQELLDLDASASQVSFSGGSFSVESGKENFPCIEVTWYGALAYCNYKSDMEGSERCIDFSDWSCDFEKPGYRLPTEAEWEKGSRGGLNGHHFPWPSSGGSWNSHYNGSKANINASGDAFENEAVPSTLVGYYNGSQAPVGVDMANGYGLYDMAGNVYDWCWDWFDENYYSVSNLVDPTGPTNGVVRLNRGGSWKILDAFGMRCAFRNTQTAPDGSKVDVGFRAARNLTYE